MLISRRAVIVNGDGEERDGCRVGDEWYFCTWDCIWDVSSGEGKLAILGDCCWTLRLCVCIWSAQEAIRRIHDANGPATVTKSPRCLAPTTSSFPSPGRIVIPRVFALRNACTAVQSLFSGILYSSLYDPARRDVISFPLLNSHLDAGRCFCV